ncbi:MAG: isocitrate lyase/phosphoenolpyruvate mutase family protein [Candidatus Latescibacterota bacterium]
MAQPSARAQRTARLRGVLAAGTVALPGAVNALSARLIEREGFEALYVSGAVLANSVGGVPDVGLMTLTELAEHCARIAAATSLPVVADADTGFGGPENAARTVRLLEAAGASGVHLEDQEFPKRCGHLAGKTLVPAEVFGEKLAAAAAARDDPDFLLIARTDARGVTGYDDAVRRAHAYLAAGADAVFPEALEGREEFARFAQDVKTVLVANMTEFGRTPYLTVEEFAQLGYAAVLFPVTLQRIAARAMQEALRVLRREGTQRGLLERMQTRGELYELLGYQAPAGAAVPEPSADEEHGRPSP